MQKPLTDEDLLDRAAIDGRVAFAVAAFLGGAGLVALLDRVGVPETLVEALGPALALVGLAIIGILLRSMRVSRFYAAGRAAPSTYTGLAMAALAAGLFLPFLPPAEDALSLGRLVVGFLGGVALAALVSGPLLRKTGAFSLPDFIGARFPNVALRLGVIAVVGGAAAFVALAGYASAVDALTSGLGVSRLASVVLVGATIVLVAAPGGLGGVLWSASGAAGVLIAGLGLPILTLVLRGAPLPFPLVGERSLWESAVTRMGEWQLVFANGVTSVSTQMIVALALGIGSLAPLLMPAMAARDRRRAQRAGIAALVWLGFLAFLVAVSVAVAALSFDRAGEGARPTELSERFIAASRAGRVRICGANPATREAAQAACAAQPGFRGVLRANDLAATGPFLAHALPDTRMFGRALSGLATAGIAAVAIALAAAAFLGVATALGHDAFYRVRDEAAMTSRRLAITRVALVAAVVSAAFLIERFPIDARTLIGLAIALCASAIAPLMALALWPRAESADATVALLSGLAAAETVIYLSGAPPTIHVFANAAVIAAGVSLVCGLATSLMHKVDPTGRGGAFVHGLLHGEADVLNPDKGA